ncbi:basic proline-rich protein-like [Panthera pardus]|uniref:Basic proline-rich protein-like n=1 Tax=Panthera pardus TaxID=9691 RepID=A0A9V1EAP7_PANPR|nr:basic proline-rich protein-like [Panthera pardus]
MEEETAAAPQKTSLGQEAASGQPDNQLSSSLHTHVAFMRQQEAPRAQEIPSTHAAEQPGHLEVHTPMYASPLLDDTQAPALEVEGGFSMASPMTQMDPIQGKAHMQALSMGQSHLSGSEFEVSGEGRKGPVVGVPRWCCSDSQGQCALTNAARWADSPQKGGYSAEKPDLEFTVTVKGAEGGLCQMGVPEGGDVLREQSRGALPGLGPRRRAARTPACDPREARTPSRQDCAPPLPVGPGERLASPPPFPPPRPVSPPSPRATGGGGGGGGRSGPGRGSPDLARCDVANQRGPKLRAQPETQLEPGPQPKSKPQSESVASEPGADEPSTQRNPRGAFVRSSRWRATERIPGKARRHRGSTRSSFLRPARSPSCRRQALPCLPGEPTPRFGPGHPKRAAAPGTRVPALRRA